MAQARHILSDVDKLSRQDLYSQHATVESPAGDRESWSRIDAVGKNAETDGADEGIELTVVIPCLNEADTLESCLEKAERGLQAAGVAGEIVVADNGSTDGSIEIARRIGVRVINVSKKGYGNALMGGIERRASVAL